LYIIVLTILITFTVSNTAFLSESETPTILPQKLGGVHDFIFTLSRETLIRWGFTTEKYHRQVNNQTELLGGLEDYIYGLTNEQIIAYVLKEIDEHPELDSKEHLDTLSTQYGLNNSQTSFHDSLIKMSRETLRSFALTAEAYHRKVLNLRYYGGLHDYTDSLTDAQLRLYIMNEAKVHPELTAEKLKELSQEYGYTPKETTAVALFLSFPPGGDGGLHDMLGTAKKSELIEMTFAIEKYHNKGMQMVGGLHDYVYLLSRKQLLEYINKELKEHPEINHLKEIKKLVKQYKKSSDKK